MWTADNRPRYNRDKLRYPSDLTDAEWAHIEPLIPPGKPGGGKRRVAIREVINGVMYILRVRPETLCRITEFSEHESNGRGLMKASALRLRFSQSLASRRQRLSQAMVRSTTQRLGWTTKPFTRSDRLTISVSRSGRMPARAR